MTTFNTAALACAMTLLSAANAAAQALPSFQPSFMDDKGWIRDIGNNILRARIVAPPRVARLPLPAAAPTATFSLDALLNRQWKTRLTLKLSGANTTIALGATVNRQSAAYAAITAPGWAQPRFFSLASIIEQDGWGTFAVGPAASLRSYQIKFPIIIFNPYASKVVIDSAGDGEDSGDPEHYELDPMATFNAVAEDLPHVTLSGSDYLVLYSQEIVDGPQGGVVKPNVKTVALVKIEKPMNIKDFRAFTIAPETLSADALSVYAPDNGPRVGLALGPKNSLKIYDNPNTSEE